VKPAAILWGAAQDLTVAGHTAFQSSADWFKLTVTDDLTFKTGDSDYTHQLTKIISQQPDAICVAALAGDAVIIVKQIRELGYSGPVLGSNGFNSPDLIKQAGPAAEGVLVGTAWNKDLDTPANRAFITAFEKKFGNSPDQFAAQSYTALNLYAGAILRTGSTDTAGLREALAGLRDIDTPLGRFSFSDQREPISSSVVQIVRNGQFEIVR